MTAMARQTGFTVPGRLPGFRYGAVFVIVLVLLVFEIVAPNEDWTRAVTVALAAAALTIALATSQRARRYDACGRWPQAHSRSCS